jgi:hypothetical protein
MRKEPGMMYVYSKGGEIRSYPLDGIVDCVPVESFVGISRTGKCVGWFGTMENVVSVHGNSGSHGFLLTNGTFTTSTTYPHMGGNHVFSNVIEVGSYDRGYIIKFENKTKYTHGGTIYDIYKNVVKIASAGDNFAVLCEDGSVFMRKK